MDQFEPLSIPDKANFKIGEVAKLLDLEPYVLRYWEEEFDRLCPEKTDSGQRVYRRSDIETARVIRKLLYTEKFTIKGARRQLDLASEGESPILNAVATGGQTQLFESTSADSSKLQDLKDKLDRAEAEIAELQRERETLTSELEQLETQRDNLRRQLETVQHQNQTLSQKLSRARRIYSSIQQRLRSLSQIKGKTASK